MIDILGFVAGFLTTLAFLPQVIKVIKTKKTEDISLVMYIIFTVGVALWLVYGIMLLSLPIIIANSLTLVLASIILVMKIIYG